DQIAPSPGGDAPTAGPERLARDLELDAGLGELERREELPEKAPADEVVHVALGARKRSVGADHRRRNDGVVGRDLPVVPSPRTPAKVRQGDAGSEARGILPYRRHLACLRKLPLGK